MSKFTIQCNKCGNKIDIDSRNQLMDLMYREYSIEMELDREWGDFSIKCKCGNETEDK